MQPALSVGSLILRVAFALSIVAVAIGMTAAASETVARCDHAAATSTAGTNAECAQAAPVPHAVAGYQAAPVPAERAAPVAADGARMLNVFAQEATGLVILATALVFVSIFAILFSYRQRPGGVRASQR
jgi:hypothetical protein